MGLGDRLKAVVPRVRHGTVWRVGLTYDPFASGVLADPYPWYRWLRRSHPCCHSGDRDVWIVSRYDDVVGVMRNHDVFSSYDGVGYEGRHTRDLISADPPEHTRPSDSGGP